MGMKLAGIMLIIMLAMSGMFYWYYNDTQERIAILNENNAKLETAVAISEEAVSTLQANIAQANAELNRVNTEFAAIRAQNNVLADKLAKHDLAVLGAGKPGLVERLIDRGSANAGRCFEILSGAPLTDKEKEATDGKSFNNECPWLWPGNSAN
jgi:DNA repair exonuclease SbcCD ATPase subunit